MFRPCPPSKYGIKRPSSHLKSCPTDLQAEVLIQRSVSANSIIGLVCETDSNLRQVKQLLLNWKGTPPVCSTRPHFFEQSYVRDLVRSGHDIRIAVRED
ncbi:DarT ssDNA thymidine ADP-ribosyltransferase family protein [Candidatus Poriferisodalis sp.]|uniref:DarT ssDNA thymidine ADP-ribosyltransferase family protein n=1 Tax=Candidatus Poriferisodalis sp. TaxID=3101277 RepID=UPI003D1242A7